MSLMTVVRHGQASFFADHYDQLSELGERQAHLLGSHWAKQRFVVDEVYAGPRARQQKTAELAGLAYRPSGLAWPETIVLNDLDEYDLDGLQKRLSPLLAQRNPDFFQMVEKYRLSEGQPEKDRLRYFQRMFESLLHHWQTTDVEHDDIESWSDFRRRVSRVIRQIQEQPGRSRRVALFTSGGFIGAAVQLALGTNDKTALELNWRIRNSSVTEFVFTNDRLNLDSFNVIPHLDDSAMWTYR